VGETIIVALISGGVTLMGVLIANSRNQAVMEAKVEELTREVREHNDFARRVPVLEAQMLSVNRRLGDIESENRKYHKREA
jgi:low affinity Fe/Cu permease